VFETFLLVGTVNLTASAALDCKTEPETVRQRDSSASMTAAPRRKAAVKLDDAAEVGSKGCGARPVGTGQLLEASPRAHVSGAGVSMGNGECTATPRPCLFDADEKHPWTVDFAIASGPSILVPAVAK
jgi:hypothetical protein